jgi:hypothetical protein
VKSAADATGDVLRTIGVLFQHGDVIDARALGVGHTKEQVRIGGRIGAAQETSRARAISYAISLGIGIDMGPSV